MLDKRLIRNRAFNYLGQYGENIRSKFGNICGKTGQRDIPTELYQKRTKRSNRILIPWKTVKSNNLTFEQLDTFEGGVVVEFMNDDFFDEENKKDVLFKKLSDRIGSNENVSSIITIRSEGGSSSSQLQRDSFDKLINNTKVKYRNEIIEININNYKKYAIKQIITGQGTGNETWTGFLFISIKGGQQDTIETHRGIEYTLFNPACDYASSDVCTDIDLVCAYFAMKSIDISGFNQDDKISYRLNMNGIEQCLAETYYDSEAYKGNLLDYCRNQYSTSFYDNQLTDPIQLKRINIGSFNIKERTNDSIDFTHIEAVNKNKFYWDSIKKCVLSPARPTNIFWSYHLSNMMQQDYNLDEYFEYEEERFKKREELIKNKKKASL